MECIKACSCKGDEVHPHGAACIFFAHKKEDHFDECIEKYSFTKLAKHICHCAVCFIYSAVRLTPYDI